MPIVFFHNDDGNLLHQRKTLSLAFNLSRRVRFICSIQNGNRYGVAFQWMWRRGKRVEIKRRQQKLKWTASRSHHRVEFRGFPSSNLCMRCVSSSEQRTSYRVGCEGLKIENLHATQHNDMYILYSGRESRMSNLSSASAACLCFEGYIFLPVLCVTV